MKSNAKENHPFIYDRTTGEKIPVSKEVRDAYYGEAARIRMKEQAHGRCVCPQSKVWACDGDCLICEYRRSGDLASLDVPVGEDGEDTLMDMLPSEAPAIESIIADRDLLDRLFARAECLVDINLGSEMRAAALEQAKLNAANLDAGEAFFHK